MSTKVQSGSSAVVQSGDKRVLTAATEIVRKGLAKITLLGDPESVSQDADRLGLDLTGITVVDHMVTFLSAAARLCLCCYPFAVIGSIVYPL